ncbi:MAG: carbon-nitrogen hydrolase family protein [Planctomycetaceae bacterium]|nr:carbon-nitrogen hydrolase family protein [Planctomycetaceae bacterium]
MRDAVSLAVAQITPLAGDVPANVVEHLELARLAADEGATTVVFPELSLTGYELHLAEKLAFREDDSRLDGLRDLATSAGITLVVGAPLRGELGLHIGAAILLPHGRHAWYTKRRLGTFPAEARIDSEDGSIPPSEKSVFQPGVRDPLVSVGTRQAAIAICADIGDATHPQQSANRGATVYLASMFVIPSDFPGEQAKLSRYAAQHAMLTALANFGGPSGSLRSAGRSSIWSEQGELLVQLAPAGSGIAIMRETPSGRTTRTRMLSN